MDDKDFVTQSTSLLARCTPEQRAQLASKAQAYGKVSGEDARRAGRSMARDGFESPAAGKSFSDMFPDAERLTR